MIFVHDLFRMHVTLHISGKYFPFEDFPDGDIYPWSLEYLTFFLATLENTLKTGISWPFLFR
jgi:hypothetical protein